MIIRPKLKALTQKLVATGPVLGRACPGISRPRHLQESSLQNLFSRVGKCLDMRGPEFRPGRVLRRAIEGARRGDRRHDELITGPVHVAARPEEEPSVTRQTAN